MNPEISPKIPCKFTCEACDYKTGNKKDYNKHLLTQKHVNTINTMKYNDKIHFIKEKEYICECGNKYKHNASLFNHKKKCKKAADVKNKDEGIIGTGISDASSNIIQLLIKESSDFKNILLEMVKSNTEIQKQMLDVCKTSNSITV